MLTLITSSVILLNAQGASVNINGTLMEPPPGIAASHELKISGAMVNASIIELPADITMVTVIPLQDGKFRIELGAPPQPPGMCQ